MYIFNNRVLVNLTFQQKFFTQNAKRKNEAELDNIMNLSFKEGYLNGEHIVSEVLVNIIVRALSMACFRLSIVSSFFGNVITSKCNDLFFFHKPYFFSRMIRSRHIPTWFVPFLED